MIVSGWILPNKEEILCGYENSNRNYGNKLHLQAVREYIENIRENNSDLYLKLSSKFKYYSFSDNYIDYEGFAISVLGWIKIGVTDFHKYIICANMFFQTSTILKYTSLGYVNEGAFVDTHNYDNLLLIV